MFHWTKNKQTASVNYPKMLFFFRQANAVNVRYVVFIQKCSRETVWTGMHIGACLYSTERSIKDLYSIC